MGQRQFVLPGLVRGKLAVAGPAGHQWLAELSRLVSDLEQRWQFTVGEVLEGGSASFAARAVRADGTRAVLKVPLPGHHSEHEIDTLNRAAGNGYVLLYEHDPRSSALLIEALGSPLDRSDRSPEEQVDILCATLHHAWQIPRGPEHHRPPQPVKATSLATYVIQAWQRLESPGARHVLDHALRCAEHRAAAFDLSSSVVVHGDPHPGNCLSATTRRPGAESGYLFVDPDGFLADRGYDLGVILRDWTPQLQHDRDLLNRLCRRMAEHTGVDPDVIWEWGYLERVSTGLYMIEFGAPTHGRQLLSTAEALRPSF